MRRARRLPLRLVRATTLCVCLALIMTCLDPRPLVSAKGAISSQRQGDQSSNGKARKVKAEPPRTGAPAATMPMSRALGALTLWRTMLMPFLCLMAPDAQWARSPIIPVAVAATAW